MPTCNKQAFNQFGEIHCDNPPGHEGDCDFGSLPITPKEPLEEQKPLSPLGSGVLIPDMNHVITLRDLVT